jgi:hypothetical protein
MERRTGYEAFASSSAQKRRLLRQEELILEVTEALARAIAAEGISKAELATRLGKSKAFVSQVLAGGRNLTLRTMADFADAVRCRIKVEACREPDVLPLTTHEVMHWDVPALATWSAKVVSGRFGKAASRVAA